MADRNDFIAGWMSGWAAASNAFTQSLSHALRGGGTAAAALAETAGNKPSRRRRGRPPKSAGMAQQAPRRRGRPPKTP